jgi:hypothetical protein
VTQREAQPEKRDERKSDGCRSVEILSGRDAGISMTFQNVLDRVGEILCGGGLRYECVSTHQARCRRRLMDTEKYDSGIGSDLTNPLGGVKTAHDGHGEIENYNVGAQRLNQTYSFHSVPGLATYFPLIRVRQ